MNKPLTINDLFKHCKDEIKKGNGDKIILLSDDDEGNGYHYCWYAFTPAEDIIEEDEFIDTDIADTNNTMILG